MEWEGGTFPINQLFLILGREVTHCCSDCYNHGILLVEVYIECRNLINILHSTPDRRKKTNKSDFAVSANIAYGQVNLEGE